MLTVLLVTCCLVLLAVGVHYNALLYLTGFLHRRTMHVRRWVAVSILGLLMAHVIEVSFFAVGYAVLGYVDAYGDLIGQGFEEDKFLDYWYFSFVSYTSLGFGDITPTKLLRVMTAFETLTGLIMIAWSASFLFVQMQHFWEEDSTQM